MRRGTWGRERREGWTGWIRRLAAIDFSRQTRGLFVPLLVLVLFPSNRPPPSTSPPSLFRSRFPSSSSSPSRASGSCRLHRPFYSPSHSLFALLLINAVPPFDSRSARLLLLSFSLFSLCAFLCIRISFFTLLSLARLLSCSLSLSLLLSHFFLLCLSSSHVLKRFNSCRFPSCADRIYCRSLATFLYLRIVIFIFDSL